VIQVPHQAFATAWVRKRPKDFPDYRSARNNRSPVDAKDKVSEVTLLHMVEDIRKWMNQHVLIE